MIHRSYTSTTSIPQLIPFPYDYFGASQLDGWRQRLILPMDFGRVRERNQNLLAHLWPPPLDLDHQDHVAAYLAALPYIMRWALVAGETAMFLDALDQEHCVSDFPEFQVLSGRDLTPGALKFPRIYPPNIEAASTPRATDCLYCQLGSLVGPAYDVNRSRHFRIQLQSRSS